MSQIWTGYNDITNVTGISYENAINRESRVSSLTIPKLTRSSAGPNLGAINYIQFTSHIVLEVNYKCKKVAF